MKFLATKVNGVFEVQPEPLVDARGAFMRSWCAREFSEQGLSGNLVQCSIAWNPMKGTLRGMHLQEAPFAESKLVRCTRGAIYDVAIDLRPESPTFKKWTGSLLTAENRNMLYIPEGCAHGFLTMEDESEVYYQMSQFHDPGSARGFRWNDPAFQIEWPEEPALISSRDQSFPDFVHFA